MHRLFCAVLALSTVAGCSSASLVSRNAGGSEVSPEIAAARSYDIARIDVSVPEALSVSEANAYYPAADIVWRGDPPGNRHLQIQTIVSEAADRGTARLDGVQDVIVSIEVKRFHAVTEKARYTVGGVHSIKYLIAVNDADTGAVVEPPRLVDASFRALGGADAIAAERSGLTQRVRVSQHLAGSILRQLTPSETSASFGAL